MVCIFDPACELLPPWKKELYISCVLLPLYCTFSLTSFPLPPFPMYSVYRQCVTGGGGGGVCWNVLWTIFCRSFTLCFWPDSEPTKLLHHPSLTKMTSKDDIKGLVSLKFLRPWFRPLYHCSEQRAVWVRVGVEVRSEIYYVPLGGRGT